MNLSNILPLKILALLPITLYAQEPIPVDWSRLPGQFLQGVDGVALFEEPYAMVYRGAELVFYDMDNAATLAPFLAKDSIPNWPRDWNTVSDIVEYDDSTNLIFRGNRYAWYDIISGSTADPVEFDGLPPEWNDRVDAALRWDQDVIWFFSGIEYVEWWLEEDGMTDPAPITDWEGWPETWDRVDAAFCRDGIAYFFSGSQVLAYDQIDARFLDGYPRPIGTK